MYKNLMFVSLLCFAGAATAVDTDRGTRVDVQEDFATQQQKIMTALDDGESYSEISKADREKVVEALSRIGSALQTGGGVNGLNADQKVAVFNDQEQVNTILTEAGDDSRLICRRAATTGSHRTTTQCMTVAERNRAAEHARQTMGNMPSHQMKDSMGGG